MSDASHIIEKRLIWMKRHSNENGLLLSSINKEFLFHTRAFEPYLYQMGKTVYAYSVEQPFIPGSELLEYGNEKALPILSELQALLTCRNDNNDEHFLIYEIGYNEGGRPYENVLYPQMDILWSHLENSFVDMRLAKAVKTAFSESESHLHNKYGVYLHSVERWRTANSCSYFNKTMQLILVFLLEERWRDVVEGFSVEAISATVEPYKLDSGFRVIAYGNPSRVVDFPVNPTDMWLVRQDLETGKILGVYTIEMEELDVLADKKVQANRTELFPPQGFIPILDSFYEQEFDSKEHSEIGLLLTSFVEFESNYLAAREIEERTKRKESEHQRWLMAMKEKNWDSLDLEAMAFSVRTYNCLKRAGVNTVADLIAMSVDDLGKVRNLGYKSVEKVCEKLRDLGIGQNE